METNEKTVQTPRTLGALTQQFEFDFGPEFTGNRGEFNAGVKPSNDYLSNPQQPSGLGEFKEESK
jgi:hypothetical protein